MWLLAGEEGPTLNVVFSNRIRQILLADVIEEAEAPERDEKDGNIDGVREKEVKE